MGTCGTNKQSPGLVVHSRQRWTAYSYHVGRKNRDGRTDAAGARAGGTRVTACFALFGVQIPNRRCELFLWYSVTAGCRYWLQIRIHIAQGQGVRSASKQSLRTHCMADYDLLRERINSALREFAGGSGDAYDLALQCGLPTFSEFEATGTLSGLCSLRSFVDTMCGLP